MVGSGLHHHGLKEPHPRGPIATLNAARVNHAGARGALQERIVDRWWRPRNRAGSSYLPQQLVHQPENNRQRNKFVPAEQCREHSSRVARFKEALCRSQQLQAAAHHGSIAIHVYGLEYSSTTWYVHVYRGTKGEYTKQYSPLVARKNVCTGMYVCTYVRTRVPWYTCTRVPYGTRVLEYTRTHIVLQYSSTRVRPYQWYVRASTRVRTYVRTYTGSRVLEYVLEYHGSLLVAIPVAIGAYGRTHARTHTSWTVRAH